MKIKWEDKERKKIRKGEFNSQTEARSQCLKDQINKSRSKKKKKVLMKNKQTAHKYIIK